MKNGHDPCTIVQACGVLQGVRLCEPRELTFDEGLLERMGIKTLDSVTATKLSPFGWSPSHMREDSDSTYKTFMIPSPITWPPELDKVGVPMYGRPLSEIWRTWKTVFKDDEADCVQMKCLESICEYGVTIELPRNAMITDWILRSRQYWASIVVRQVKGSHRQREFEVIGRAITRFKGRRQPFRPALDLNQGQTFVTWFDLSEFDEYRCDSDGLRLDPYDRISSYAIDVSSNT